MVWLHTLPPKARTSRVPPSRGMGPFCWHFMKLRGGRQGSVVFWKDCPNALGFYVRQSLRGKGVGVYLSCDCHCYSFRHYEPFEAKYKAASTCTRLLYACLEVSSSTSGNQKRRTRTPKKPNLEPASRTKLCLKRAISSSTNLFFFQAASWTRV